MIGEKYTNSPDYLKEGDILVTRTKGHTLVILNDGDKVQPEPTPEPPEPPTPPTPPVAKQMVYVIGKSVNVRTTDSKKGKVMFVAHKGNKFDLIDVSEDTGWYHIETHKGPGYISNRADLTCLITI